MFIEVPDSLKRLSKFFPENLYVVGGYVRNKILGLSCDDIDITSSVDVEEVSKRLKGSEFSVKIKNLKFGTILITSGKVSFEYTAFRREVYADNGGHCPIRVEKAEKLEEDAVRRDFTINAIYYNVNKDECVDLFHGVVDLSQKLIRCTIEPDRILRNDGERILRMVRIAGEIGLRIEKQTLISAKKFVLNLQDISGNRKLLEIEKILYCDKRYNRKPASFKKAMKLLNVLGVWKAFGLVNAKVKYGMVSRCEDRFLGLLIDIVNTEKPECLEEFLENFLKVQFGFNASSCTKIFKTLAGYYSALSGMKNKEYFFEYFEDWSTVEPLLRSKSKRVAAKYNFFYEYIIKHELAIRLGDLKIDANEIKKSFPSIDSRHYDRILKNLLSKVFDGKVENSKEALLEEIRKNLINY